MATPARDAQPPTSILQMYGASSSPVSTNGMLPYVPALGGLNHFHHVTSPSAPKSTLLPSGEEHLVSIMRTLVHSPASDMAKWQFFKSCLESSPLPNPLLPHLPHPNGLVPATFLFLPTPASPNSVPRCGKGGGTSSFWCASSSSTQMNLIVRARLVTDADRAESPIGLCYNDVAGKNAASRLAKDKDLVRGVDYISVKGMPRPFTSKDKKGGGSQTTTCVLTRSGVVKLMQRHLHTTVVEPNKTYLNFQPALSFTGVLGEVVRWIDSGGVYRPEGFCFPWQPITMQDKEVNKYREMEFHQQNQHEQPRLSQDTKSTGDGFVTEPSSQYSQGRESSVESTSSTLSAPSSSSSSSSRAERKRKRAAMDRDDEDA